MIKEATKKKIDLGRCGEVTLHLDAEHKHLLIDFEVDGKGFDKSSLNAFVEALKKVRDRMER